jgi:hypothetical protein
MKQRLNATARAGLGGIAALLLSVSLVCAQGPLPPFKDDVEQCG